MAGIVAAAGRRPSAASYPMGDGAPAHERGPRPLRRRAALLTLGLATFLACQTTPITGRQAFNVFSVTDDVELGRTAYVEILAGEPVVGHGPGLRRVEEVMAHLVTAADAAQYEWEVKLLDEPGIVNAFALPGGKLAVYSGILPVCRDEDGLAVVMGHEIGHVVARHGTQRITSQMGVQVVLAFLDLGDYAGLAEAAADVLVGLPFSRTMETEADHIGLIYMARAGYDPREAVEFWGRMDERGGALPFEFLSTHPSHETRVADLEALLPGALREWQASPRRLQN